MNAVETYYSDDYAGLDTEDYSFYFGYERADPVTEEWMFVVRKNGSEVFTLCSSDIENKTERRQLNMPQDYLIAGIGIWLNEKKDK